MPQTLAVAAPPSADPATLRAWCEEHLGAPPVEELFTSAHLSRVTGVRLGDGTSVVVKVRTPAARLAGCFEVHRHLFLAGFPCPEPIVGPTPMAEYAATAERYVPGGSPLPSSGRSAPHFASALAELIRLAPRPDEVPTLDPPPPWTACGHPGEDLWPTPDDLDVDLNEINGPVWVDNAAAAVRNALAECRSEPVIGHGDWYAANLTWNGDQLLAVHDWDSVISAPEPVIVGLAASSFASTGGEGEEVTVDETAQFIAEYQAAAGRDFPPVEVSYAWAAGLWLRVFDAKKEFARTGEAYSCDESAVYERLHRMG